MKKLKEQNPLVLAFAIIGGCALIYGGWLLYQRHASQELENAIRYGPPQGPATGFYQPSKKPPPQ
jgi:hypothetical protein